MPMINVAPKSTAKLGAAIVSSVPPMWPTAAKRASVRIPSTSHSGPPNRIETPNPQNAAPAIHPTSVAVRLKTVSKSPMMSPRMANDIAVAINATQLDLNGSGLASERYLSTLHSQGNSSPLDEG